MAKKRVFKKIKKYTDNHFLIFRSAKTGRITKYRKNRRFIVEVRSRKTKRVVGYLNDTQGRGKKRKLMPRKFTRNQLLMKQREKTTADMVLDSESQMRINFRTMLIEQIEEKGAHILEKVQDELSMNDECFLGIRVTADDGRFDLIDGYKMLVSPMNDREIAIDLGMRTINMLRSETFRTSPKKYINKKSKNRDRKMAGPATLTILFGGRPI